MFNVQCSGSTFNVQGSSGLELSNLYTKLGTLNSELSFKGFFMKNRLLLLPVMFVCAGFGVYGQSDTVRLSLFDAIEMAKEGSYDALIAENEYMAAYWSYQNFRSSGLPTLDLYARPSTFNRSINKQFNPMDTSYNYFEEQNLNSYLSLSLNQNLPFSGGKVYVDSDFGKLSNFGDRESKQYSATAFRVGLQQPIFSFNRFKWDRKLQPLKYEIKQKYFAQAQEEITLKAVDYFFNCSKAELRYRMAKNNLENADSLYAIGAKRFDLLSIGKSELLSLKLEAVNAANNMKQALNFYERSAKRLLSFLGMGQRNVILPIIPEAVPALKVDGMEVLEKAKKYNPDYLEFRCREMEAEMRVEQTRIDNRFKASLSASYGLNQRSQYLTGVYDNMLDQERFDVTLNIPLVDWGVRRNRYNLVQRERDASLFSIKQQQDNLEQDILMSVSEFNLQEDLTASAKEAADLAVDVFEMTMKRFLIGEVTVNDLIIQSDRKDAALNGYYNEINEYWRLFYTIRKIAMYDFVSDSPIDLNTHSLLLKK